MNRKDKGIMGTYCFIAYLWIVSISLGVVYNIFGEIIIFIPLLLMLIYKKHMVINRDLYLGIGATILFIILKSLNLKEYEPINLYFSIVSTILDIFEISFLAVLLYAVKDDIYENLNFRNKLIKVFLTCFHLSLIVSIAVLIMKGSDIYRVNQSAGGILLAPQFYILFSVVVSMLLFYWILNRKKNRWIYMILLLINLIYIYMSNYTTQMIFEILGLLLVLLFCNVKKTKNMIIGLMILIVAALIIFPNMTGILRFIDRTFFAENVTVSIRINEIIALISLEDISGTDLLGRFDLIQLSIDTFQKHWLIGIPFENYNSVVTGQVVGGHCEWADDLARYGVAGCILFLNFIWLIIKKVIVNGDVNQLEKAIFVLFIMYGFFNPFIKVSTFLFCFLICMFSHYEENKTSPVTYKKSL